MRNFDNAKWDFSKEEELIFDYLEQRGFDLTLIKQYQSKTVIEISKNDISDKVEIPSIPMNKKNATAFSERAIKNFEMLVELNTLRRLAND